MKKTLLSVLVAAAMSNVAMADEENQLEFSGAIEIEAHSTKDESENKTTSDITAATVELAADYKASDKVDGHILFLYEQEAEGEPAADIEVDEAVINLHPKENLDISVGRMYVPFGNFDTMMLSDPQTLELGETQEEAALVAISNGKGLSASLYAFKDSEDTSEKIDDFGASVGYESDKFAAGVSYISDVNDKSTATKDAKGVGVHAKANLGKATIIAEHVNVDTVDKPKATNFEVGFDLGNDRTIALGAQKTKNAAGIDLPKEVYGIAFSTPVYENTTFTAEYANHKQYDSTKDDVFTLQLAYEF